MRDHLIYGLHAVMAALQNKSEKISRLYVARERQDKKIKEILFLAKENNIPIESEERKELDQLAGSPHHQGVIACCQKNQSYTENDLQSLLAAASRPFVLILDGVQDPHNLGACLRTANAAGVHCVIAPKDRSVGMTPTVSKVACGAAETLPFIQVTNLVRTIQELKNQGIWIYGAAAEAEQSLYQLDLTGPLALVLGAEQSGLRRLTREHCDGLASIPMQGSVSSLNVSVATGIMLYEAVRQRLG